MAITDLVIYILQGIVSVIVSLIAYFTRRRPHYGQISADQLVEEVYFLYTGDTYLRRYLDDFLIGKRRYAILFAPIAVLTETVLAAFYYLAVFDVVFLALFIVPILDFAYRRRKHIENSQTVFLRMVLCGRDPIDRRQSLRPKFTYMTHAIVYYSLIGLFASFVVGVLLDSTPAFQLSNYSSVAVGVFVVFLFTTLTFLFTPTYRDFQWLSYETLLKEIVNEMTIKLRIHVDTDEDSSLSTVKGFFVASDSKHLVLKIPEGEEQWQESFKWKKIKRMSIQLKVKE